MSFKSKFDSLRFLLKKKRVVVMCRVYYGEEWLKIALKNVEPYVYKIFILKSSKPWTPIDGISKPIDSKADDVTPILNELSNNSTKYIVIERDWGTLHNQLESFWTILKKDYPEVTHMWIVDSDEIYTGPNAKKMVSLCSNWKYYNKALRVNMYTYIKTIYYRVFPIEPYKPLAIIPIRDFVYFSEARNVEGVQKVVTDVYMHHFSLVMKNEERLQMKFHRNADEQDEDDNWYDMVYKNFSPSAKNFHIVKGQENTWASVEVLTSSDLPIGVEETYKSWGENE